MSWFLLGVIVVCTVAGDILQSREMKRSGEQTANARGLARLVVLIVTRAPLFLGIACMAVSFFAFMALLQIAPLSFAVPASAASIALETALAKFLLNEVIGARRFAGATLVLIGVILLAR